jgi:hypothetical protein
MIREECREGMIVEFGRETGERTKGIIVKMNPKKAKVRTLEGRGSGRGSQVGAVWGVPYSMMVAVQDAATETAVVMQSFAQPQNPAFKAFAQAKSVADQPVPYSPFQNHSEQLILEAIHSVYSELSPEFLTCDGELPFHVVNARRSKLQSRLNYLFKAFGREVSETAVWKWMEDKKNKQEV